MLSDGETEETLKAMYAEGYLCEPHGAIAYQLLKDQLKADETGILPVRHILRNLKSL